MIRLEDLLAEVVPQPSRRSIAQTVDFIVHIRRTGEGRRLDGLLALEGLDEAGNYRLTPQA